MDMLVGMGLSRRTLLATSAFALFPFRALAARPRLPRKYCFFGLHFDLHPSKTDTALGRDLTDEMVERLLTRVRPDFVQYDCKGHAGYLGFASKLGTSAPGIVKDSLEIWRRVTARRGVALYIHFSGVWDALAVAQHPEWARVAADGQPDKRSTSTFGAYEDKLMIPELDEAIARYSLDGAWIDGDCWAVAPDYSARAREAFVQRSGSSTLPVKPEDAGWLEFLEFNREQFRRYVRHYVDELHRLHPGVQIASNWLYSSYVPERPEIPVDYLSGDFLGATPVSSARLEARYLASTGKPWDLMSWGFVSDRGTTVHKQAVQLKQEAAAVITQGGGYQIYYNPTRAGWIDDRLVDVMAEVAQFCRERQPVSFQTEPVRQIGVLFSRHSLYSTSNRMFGGWGAFINPARGIVDALLAAHYSVEILPDWRLEDAPLYPAIVVPDWLAIGAGTRDALNTYARDGGALVVVGAANARTFSQQAGVHVLAVRDQNGVVFGKTGFGAARGAWADIEASGARIVEHRFPDFDSRAEGVPAAAVAKAGQGTIALIPGPLGTAYALSHSPALHELLHRVVRRVFEPMVTIQGPDTVEVTLRRKDKQLLVHLTNLTAMQVGAEFPVVDFIPRVGPVVVSIRLPRRPSKVKWEPGGHDLGGGWANGMFQITVEHLDVHGTLSMET